MFTSIIVQHQYSSYNKYAAVNADPYETLVLNLTDPEGSNGFAVLSVDGLGAGKATVNTTEWAILDGCSITNIKLPKRTISIDLRFIPYFTKNERGEDVYVAVEDIREWSYLYFPIKKQVRLTFNRESSYGGQDVFYIDGIIDKNEPNIWSNEEGCSISITCEDPYFQNNDEYITAFQSIEPMFHFLYSDGDTEESHKDGVGYYPDEAQDTGSINCTHGSTIGSLAVVGPTSVIEQHDRLPIPNPSNIDVGAVFILKCINGTVKNPEIENLTTNQGFRLLYTMSPGEEITIDTRDAKHSIKSTLRDNILAYVDITKDDWIGFIPGENSVQRNCSNTGGLNNFQLTIKLKPRFVGI